MHEMRLEPAQSAKDDPVVLVSGYAVHDESVSYTADGDRYASSNLVSGTIWRWRPNAVGDDKLSEACALVTLSLLRAAILTRHIIPNAPRSTSSRRHARSSHLFCCVGSNLRGRRCASPPRATTHTVRGVCDSLVELVPPPPQPTPARLPSPPPRRRRCSTSAIS